MTFGLARRMWWTAALAAATIGLLVAPFAGSAEGPSTAALDAANPIRSVSHYPFGMEEFFAESFGDERRHAGAGTTSSSSGAVEGEREFQGCSIVTPRDGSR
jgi:hypothetical protein